MLKDPFELLNDHVDVSHGTFLKLKLYHDLLLKWQNTINLIGKDTIGDSWNRHFLDSLQIIKLLPDNNKTIVDLGSGAGFPGMILAIMGFTHVHLIESDSRKCAFLKEVARITETKISIHNTRIENNTVENIDIFVSRACASLDNLLHLCKKNISRETICLFHKGKNYSNENTDARINWNYDIEVTPSIIDPQSVILKLSNVGRLNNGQEGQSKI